MINEIKKLLSLAKKQEKKIENLKELVERDFLTGIYNRRGFINETEKFLDELKLPANIKERRKLFVIKNLSIIFIDLDNIKIVNDTFNHEAGDKVLIQTAKLFKKTLREIDVLARWGGDEFVIALLGVNEKEAFKVAEKLRKKLMRLRVNFKNKKIEITASFGVISALTKKHKKITINIHNLVDKADKVMYKAKKDFGKNFVVAFHKKLRTKK